MNQILKKTSFVSGLVLLIPPIIFSSVLKFVLSLKDFLYIFSPDRMVLYIRVKFEKPDLIYYSNIRLWFTNAPPVKVIDSGN